MYKRPLKSLKIGKEGIGAEGKDASYVPNDMYIHMFLSESHLSSSSWTEHITKTKEVRDGRYES